MPPARGGQAAMVIMQHTAIAHEAATGRVGEELSCGLDTVLQRHGKSVARIVGWGKGRMEDCGVASILAPRNAWSRLKLVVFA
ncbi:hypothetical protein NBRC116590_27710 [Pelagimonas sp. KU-00592-HH]